MFRYVVLYFSMYVFVYVIYLVISFLSYIFLVCIDVC